MNAHPDNAFENRIAELGFSGLYSDRATTLQVNMGKVCNQACKHCHVDAGPNRTESMNRETIDQVIHALHAFHFETLDITGGAPELNPYFRLLATEAVQMGMHVMVRHNFTVQFTPGCEDLPQFFSSLGMEVIASLPYFLQQQTDAQRGRGVFAQSLQAMRRLNEAGYGQEDTNLLLNLVYNPAGAFFPPAQEALEQEFKRELLQRYQLKFNHLYTLTNMPISRFLHWLQQSGNEARYLKKLKQSFNPAALPGLMCRSTLNVGWDGKLYDCDFNQMLELPAGGETMRLEHLTEEMLQGRRIATGEHCFGCTAGCGSSCGGAIIQTGGVA